jgi:hypothetical protein
MMIREQRFFVIPGRSRQRANPESPLQTNLGIPGPARCAVPE